MRFKHILVAVDGSECAAHALAVASTLAVELSAQIGLVHVIDPKSVPVGSETGVPADQAWALARADAQGLLDTASAAISGNAQAWKFLRDGTPWKEIVESAREWPADLIVVGTHGRSGPHVSCSGAPRRGLCATPGAPSSSCPPRRRPAKSTERHGAAMARFSARVTGKGS
jgi:nucleotide-binding universal stress UspA family protein